MPSNVLGTVNAVNNTGMAFALGLLVVQTNLKFEAGKISSNWFWEKNENERKREESGKEMGGPFPTGESKKRRREEEKS